MIGLTLMNEKMKKIFILTAVCLTFGNGCWAQLVESLEGLEIPAWKTDGSTLLIKHCTEDIDNNEIRTYSLEFDKATRHARWVAFRFDDVTRIKNNDVSRRDKFKNDPFLPDEYKIGNASFKDYGCDRGHICASEDRTYDQTANDQTFYMSNMSAQYSSFNEGHWKTLEEHIRSLGVDENFADVLYVVKGAKLSNPISEIIRSNGHNTILPAYYYMVLLQEKSIDGNKGYRAIGFWLKNEQGSGKSKDDLKIEAKNIDWIETQTGIDFFPELDDDVEIQVESKEIDNNVLIDWGFTDLEPSGADDPLIVHDPSIATYDILASVTPADGGTVTLDKTKAIPYAIVSITATPAFGYIYEGNVSVKDANDNPITVTDGKFEMPESNVTVNATFTKVDDYNVFCYVNGNMVETQKIAVGATMDMPSASAPDGCTLIGWSLDEEGSSLITFPYKPTNNVNIYAVFSGPVFAYNIIGSIADGDEVVLGATLNNKSKTFIMGEQNNDFRDAIEVQPIDESLPNVNGAQVIKMEENGDYYRFNVGENLYLYHATSGNVLRTGKSSEASQNDWSVSITDNLATIQNRFINSNNEIFYLQFNNNRTAYRFSGYKDTQINPSFYKAGTTNEKFTAYTTLTITDAGYATYFSNRTYRMPMGMQGAIATLSNDGKSVILSYNYPEGAAVPANTGLILKGEPGDYVAYYTTTTESSPAENILYGRASYGKTTVGDDTEDSDYLFYKFSYNNSNTALGFYWGETDGEAFEIDANRGYLALTKDQAAKVTNFDIETLITSIASLSTETGQQQAAIYNLAGQRVGEDYRGIVIINGKKYLK